MKVRLKPNLLIVSGETPEEIRELAEWAGRHDDHAFWLTFQDEQTFRMIDLGPQPDACREPLNILSTSSDPDLRILSNFAETPFELDGRTIPGVIMADIWMRVREGLHKQHEATP